MGVFGFALAAAFWPEAMGAGTTPRWALAGVALPALVLLAEPRERMDLGSVFGLALCAWAFTSLAWASNLTDGLWAAWRVVICALAWTLGRRIESPRPFFVGAALGMGLSSGVALVQWAGWPDVVWPHMDGHSGLFVNSGLLSEAAALVVVGCAAFGVWWGVALAMPGILVNESRTAWVAMGAAFGVWLWSRGPAARMTAIGLGTIAVLGGLTTWWLGWKSFSTTVRAGLWLDAWAGVTWLGHGLGAYFTDIPLTTVHLDTAFVRADHAHSDILELLYELGPVGLALAVACGWMGVVRSSARYRAGTFVSCAFFAQLALAFPSASPFVLVAGFLCCGWCSRGGVDYRSALATRRIHLYSGHAGAKHA